jgi:hypothetical protein
MSVLSAILSQKVFLSKDFPFAFDLSLPSSAPGPQVPVTPYTSPIPVTPPHSCDPFPQIQWTLSPIPVTPPPPSGFQFNPFRSCFSAPLQLLLFLCFQSVPLSSMVSFLSPYFHSLFRAGIFKKSMGTRHRGGIGFSYRPARLYRLAEFIPWNQCRGPINI